MQTIKSKSISDPDQNQDNIKEQANPSKIVQWVQKSIKIENIKFKYKLQGNNLHILCESTKCPEQSIVISRLVQAIQAENLPKLFEQETKLIYQIILYGRTKGNPQPKWVEGIILEQIEQKSSSQDPAKIIANYLSLTMSPLGVSIQVVIQQSASEHSRVWIYCESNYSLDTSWLPQTLACQIREFVEQNNQLQGYKWKDAVIRSQVWGESEPDWVLRVDLTPRVQMLKEWATWGDIQSLSRLINQNLIKLGVQVQVNLKETTLHIFCRVSQSDDQLKTQIKQHIEQTLTEIEPQGIQSATLYGVKFDLDQEPIWIDWLSLPSSIDRQKTLTTLSLAQQGAKNPLIFILERFINPDLDHRLATGGIRIQVSHKQDLLHIMCEALVCPAQSTSATAIAKFVKQLEIQGINGVRIYGRRNGQSTPQWTYGVDYFPRRRVSGKEIAPEFAFTAVPDTPPLKKGKKYLKPEQPISPIKSVGFNLVDQIKQTLSRSQLFLVTVESSEIVPLGQITKPQLNQGWLVAIIWSLIGILLTFQADLIFQTLRTKSKPAPIQNQPIETTLNPPSPTPQPTPGGFTKTGQETIVITPDGQALTINEQDTRKSAATTSILAAARAQNPTFNNPLLDQKLALYQERVKLNGPADILIIGSSRALRGIDPMVLQKELSKAGYPKVEIFNYGINGATAQVVDFILREILTPQQLPKLILWADGARAFNSGRNDLTFESIINSPGYNQLRAGTFPNLNKQARTNQSFNLKTSYQDLNKWLNNTLGIISSNHQHRDQLQTTIRDLLANTLPQNIGTQTTSIPPLINTEDQIDFDGFLPISFQFNPKTYYQKFPHVSGAYDGDYQLFQLDGIQDKALTSLMEYANQNKVKIVFINTPLTDQYLDPVRTKYEQQFSQYMIQQSVNQGFIFRDLVKAWPQKHQNFSDPSHLNRYGAINLTTQIAQDPLIPWTILKQ